MKNSSALRQLSGEQKLELSLVIGIMAMSPVSGISHGLDLGLYIVNHVISIDTFFTFNESQLFLYCTVTPLCGLAGFALALECSAWLVQSTTRRLGLIK